MKRLIFALLLVAMLVGVSVVPVYAGQVTIRVKLFADTDRDGVQDAGEPTAGWNTYNLELWLESSYNSTHATMPDGYAYWFSVTTPVQTSWRLASPHSGYCLFSPGWWQVWRQFYIPGTAGSPVTYTWGVNTCP